MSGFGLWAKVSPVDWRCPGDLAPYGGKGSSLWAHLLLCRHPLPRLQTGLLSPGAPDKLPQRSQRRGDNPPGLSTSKRECRLPPFLVLRVIRCQNGRGSFRISRSPEWLGGPQRCASFGLLPHATGTHGTGLLTTPDGPPSGSTQSGDPVTSTVTTPCSVPQWRRRLKGTTACSPPLSMVYLAGEAARLYAGPWRVGPRCLCLDGWVVILVWLW